MGADRLSLKEAPMSSSSLNQVFKAQLKALGIYTGETPHGLCRGTLQATALSPNRHPCCCLTRSNQDPFDLKAVLRS